MIDRPIFIWKLHPVENEKKKNIISTIDSKKNWRIIDFFSF
jgi:hypothetical protein